jgi:hypothetical protein
VAASTLSWTLATSGLLAAVLFDRRLDQIGRRDLATFAPETWVLVAAIASALVVGSALAVRRPEHPVGWLFLALGVSMAAAGAIDGYAVYGAVARPGSLPGAGGAARLGDVIFVPWLVLVAAVLHLTPTGRALTRAWDLVLRATVLAGGLAVLSAVLGNRTLDPPLDGVDNPWAIDALASPLGLVGIVATLGVGLGLVAGARRW